MSNIPKIEVENIPEDLKGMWEMYEEEQKEVDGIVNELLEELSWQ